MPTSKTLALKPEQTLASYPVLLRRVRQTLTEGRERAADAVEREKVRTCWETGKLIQEHILINKDRADYGKQVLKRLSGDLGISVTEIQYMVEFVRAYPIYPLTGKLNWGLYRELLGINDAKLRQQLAQETSKNNWSQNELRREIKKLKATKQITVTEISPEVLIPVKGKLDTYRIVIAKAGPWRGKQAIDLGFSNYYVPPGDLHFRDRAIIQVSKGGKLTQVEAPAGLFTYRAYVLDVTDADTLWVLIDLGFGFTTQQQLRLRGIDAPEIDSRDGQAAKKFLARILKKTPEVIIVSTKSDKYDRYLADLWAGNRYLNQELLDKGLAVRATG